jgi:hypothetical protein
MKQIHHEADSVAATDPVITRYNMNHAICRTGLGFVLILAFICYARPAPAADAESFEISSIKAVRPTLTDTISALQERDLARAKVAFEAYDSGWNGIETYINVRSKAMYDELELKLQARIIKGMEAPNPDFAALLADAQTMLAKYDETIAMVANAPPLNPLYDDIARLRIVRAHLREVIPALKAGNITKARKSFDAFDDTWFEIEDFVRWRSLDAFVAIEKGEDDLEQAFMGEKPDVVELTALVNGVMTQYNSVVVELLREARSQR